MLLPKNYFLIKKLTSAPYNLSGRLARIVSSNPPLGMKFIQFNPENISKENEKELITFIDDLEHQMKHSSDANIKNEWIQLIEKYLDYYNYGYPGPVQTIIAMILSGAFIEADMSKNSLRSDISERTRKERINYSKYKNQNSYNPHKFVKAYDKLKIRKDNTLFSKIMELLAPKNLNTPLKLGRDLASLDIETIESYRKKYFVINKKYRKHGIWKGRPLLANELQPNTTLSAPNRVNYKLKKIICEQQQQNERDDDIFLISNFTTISNLKEVYDQIDESIKSGRLEDISLNYQPVTKTSQSTLKSFITGTSHDYDFVLGDIDLYEGFGPFILLLDLYEDDNDEYKAVQEVLEQVSTYADIVSEGASIVAAVTAPTPVAGGAVIISSLAEYVKICADVSHAVVGIANYLDKDDSLGSQEYSSDSDFVNKKPETINLPVVDLGNYLLSIDKNLVGQEKVNRVWQYKMTHGESKPIRSKETTILSPGFSKDYNVTFKMDNETCKIVNSTIDHEPNTKGHAKFIKKPTIKEDKITAEAKIHVGFPGYGEVTDKVIANGIYIFNNPL